MKSGGRCINPFKIVDRPAELHLRNWENDNDNLANSNADPEVTVLEALYGHTSRAQWASKHNLCVEPTIACIELAYSLGRCSTSNLMCTLAICPTVAKHRLYKSRTDSISMDQIASWCLY